MISCHQHDYIEIACLYRLRLRLTLSDGESLEGRARDTGSRQGREWLKLALDGEEREIDLERVRLIEALDRNPYFQTVQLS